MSDITKCTNNECPIKYNCKRWTALPDPDYQSYARFEYKPWGCDSYWEVFPLRYHNKNVLTNDKLGV